MNVVNNLARPLGEEPEVRLLLVDDRPENLYSLRQILASEGYALDLASSGTEAMRYLLRNRYACILCDVQMPEMNGVELVKLVRADPLHGDTAVMFVTAHSHTNQLLLEALDLGALDFVTKPIEPQVLRAKVRVFVRLQRKHLELAAQHDLFDATMGALHEGVVVTDGECGAVFVNRAMQRLWHSRIDLEVALRQFQHVPIYHATTHDVLPIHENPFYLAEQGLTVVAQEILLFREKTEGQYWNVSVLPVTSATRRNPVVALVVRDVTSERRALVEIRSKNRDLEQYAYAASHDLKAPLRHIRAFANILQQELQGTQTDAAKGALTFMVQAAEDMRQLIDGLLELSTAGVVALERETFAVGTLASEVWSKELADVAPPDATLSVETPTATIWADRGAMRRVFVNLLENAIKFRRKDVPLILRINVSQLPTVDRVTVRDNGIGIASEHAERIFQVFQRLHAKGEYAGCGIGLALCKRVLELHGGSIWVATQIGTQEGTSVVMELPRFMAQRLDEGSSAEADAP